MRFARPLRVLAACAAMALAPAFGAAPSQAPAAPALSESDQQCVGCHGQPGLTKAFAQGDPLSLHVDGEAFARSVHAPVGCAACHAGVDTAKHPGPGKAFKSAREFSAAASQACKGCHEEIFVAYSASQHGQAQGKAGPVPAPICADCHSAHQVERASSGTHLRDTCLGCHGNAIETHDQWLPNTKRHLSVVSCAACHSPGAEKRLDLRLFDLSARAEATGQEQSAERAARAGNGGSEVKPLDAKALRDLMQGINDNGGGGKVFLVGRLEARTGVEAHGLAAKGKAVKDCATCHRKGSDAFRNVTLSVIGTDGKRVRYEAQQDVLHAPTSVDSMRGFYAAGGTRVKVLDIVLALALVAGIAAPMGHAIVRRFMRSKDKDHA